MVLTLIGPLDNPRVHRILLVAAFAGTKLKVVPITIGNENETDAYYRNCHPLGRVPALRSDEGYLFETNAIIRYIARTERPYDAEGREKTISSQHPIPYTLYGKTLHEAALVDAWLDFVLTELDPPNPNAWRDGLGGLESRLLALRAARKMTGGEEFEDGGLSEDGANGFGAATPRESATLRGYSTYNISGQIRARIETPPPPSALPSPRATCTPRLSAPTPRSSVGTWTTDMMFLVGDSLTAADLVVAIAVHQGMGMGKRHAEVKREFPQTVRFSNAVLRLPVAAEVRRALGISLHS